MYRIYVIWWWTFASLFALAMLAVAAACARDSYYLKKSSARMKRISRKIDAEEARLGRRLTDEEWRGFFANEPPAW